MKTEPTDSNDAADQGSVSSRQSVAAAESRSRSIGNSDVGKPDRILHNGPPLWLVVTAFATVYIIWGSTYLGIRYAVQSIPPFLMAGSRHLAAGIFLFAFARLRGAASPSWIQWRDATIAGTLMLVIGNGGVTWAEQKIPS